MSGYHSTFYKLGHKDDFSAKAWKSAFSKENETKWDSEQSGSIQYFDDDGEQHSLIINYKQGHGLAFSLDRYNKADFSRNRSMLSVGQPSKINRFECVDSGATVSLGSFVPFEAAWPIVEHFLREPHNLPNCVEWIDANNLDWPEDY